MFEVTFRAKHECPYVRFSMKHPDLRIVEWCNRRTDVLEVECGDIETFNRVEPDLQNLLLWKGGKVLRKTFAEKNVQVITKTCRDTRISPSISGVVEKNSCLEIPPVIYHGGWETHKAMGFRESDYKKLFKDLGKLGPVEVVSKRVYAEKSMIDTFAVSLSLVFSELTTKQIEAIAAALELGYYKVPKKMTTQELAQRLKVPRTTFEEHLRKAESKVLHALSPYITLYAHRPTTLQQIALQIQTK
jgi:predicted DNA binding protein